MCALASTGTMGSSPLTRGKLHLMMQQLRKRGLIPTHAGKTCFKLGGDHTGWAHPHSRGENNECARLVDAVAGSSPLTRGKRKRWVC